MPPDSSWLDSISLFDVISFLALVIGAGLYIRSNAAKANTQETHQLAETRGERIVDLEAEVHRLSDRLSKVEGQMNALQALKAQEIASEVARLLRAADPATGTPNGF